MLKIYLQNAKHRKYPYILVEKTSGEYKGKYKLNLNINEWFKLDEKSFELRECLEDERVSLLEDLAGQYLDNLVEYGDK